MRDLMIAGGDLALTAGSDFGMVGQGNYITQRIATALAEPFDSDPYETGWGSYLDSWIGTVITASTPALVADEAARVLAILIAAQRQMITSWSLTGSRAQLAAGDTIAQVLAVNAQLSPSDPSSVLVWLQLVTQAGETLQVVRTVTTQLASG